MATGYMNEDGTFFDGSNTSTSTKYSPWFMLGKILSPSIMIKGLAGSGDTVSIRILNQPDTNIPYSPGQTNPNTGIAGTDVGVPHYTLGNVTTDTGAPMGASFTWVCAKKTAPSGNPIVVTFHAQLAK